jgi:hypothetical protein
MPCQLNSSIAKTCRDGSPGLVTVYVTEFANYTQGTITSASGIITNVASFLTSGKKFWTYALEYGVGNEVENINPNAQTGTLAINQNLNFYIPKKQASVAQQIMVLAQTDLLFIVKDKNGAYRLLGEEFGMRMAASTAPSGTAANDQSGYVLAFTAEERTLAKEVPSSLITALTTPA